MITREETAEIITKGKQDGARLFTVSDFTYKLLIVINWITGIVGGIAAAAMLAKELVPQGIAVSLLVLVVCLLNYAGAVLSTHIAKVLVHILFANLAILDKDNK